MEPQNPEITDLLQRRLESYEHSLEILNEQVSLYINPEDVPQIIKNDINTISMYIDEIKRRVLNK